MTLSLASSFISSAGLFGVGFVMGLRHALDADHVAAISTIVSRSRGARASAVVGIAWGIGHGLTLLAVGLVVVAAKLAIPQTFSMGGEFVAGIALVALGVRALRRARRDGLHVHAHVHGGNEHVHVHAHADTRSHEHVHVPFAVGMIHGLAGSAGLSVLAIAASPTISGVFWYMLTFTAGTTLGMLATSVAIGFPLRFAGRFPRFRSHVIRIAGSASVALGLAIMGGIGMRALRIG